MPCGGRKQKCPRFSVLVFNLFFLRTTEHLGISSSTEADARGVCDPANDSVVI